MDFERALDYLQKVESKGFNLGLDHVKTLIANLPLDLENITFLQIAGTNGKGSTANFLASILQTAGYKTGLFVSPHLYDIRERISVNKEWISQEDFAAGLTRIKEIAATLLEKKIISQMPTFFEYTFLLALYYFSEQKVRFAILEVGLGGRLDATTAVTPAVSLITGIARDHTVILGNKLSDIAAEKAGIIKHGVPVVCGCGSRTLSNRIIKKIASEKNAPFYNVLDSKNKLEVLEKNNTTHCTYQTGKETILFEVRLNGRFQARNAAAAVKAILLLQPLGFHITKESITNGIKNTRVPARIESLATSPPVILDAGHNLECVRKLTDYLEQEQKKNLTLIFGVLQDKNYKQMAELLLPFVDNIILTEPLSNRALPAEKLRQLLKRWNKNNISIENDYNKALKNARQKQHEILITGSFYLVGKLRNLILNGAKYG
ncbi:MAG: bifunctional folylpolyglutamate synthase/dihydrofolate synthase [bacterium]|nr:bifunctional folylpolyglutamate synthase/dihydrofolate synthase [bacterium]